LSNFSNFFVAIKGNRTILILDSIFSLKNPRTHLDWLYLYADIMHGVLAEHAQEQTGGRQSGQQKRQQKQPTARTL
jgi:hypothetical protein